ncbi:glycoside hydrolase, family 18 [Alkaliphilus metalliredigens QYMF]|uniref:Glycoside hydrolase, family 18 n=1 Tax=Alkaliphilus metalliredigens (strain QYMF) TaxID=293826 RepID=A6TUD7_ALKMQ|nr:glycosyl hydrolase family 18 protein [Alkaliphilus metalliredigens]ABR49805.1 glycoside hydrolase, family 18 [Alkaliphilus metalliredigens QYMF]
MKKWMTYLLIMMIFIGSAVPSVASGRITTLKDISNHWIRQEHETVLYLFQHLRIVSGYPDGTFKPQNDISRAELITMLVRAQGDPKQKMDMKQTFQDVTSTHWAYPFIQQAVKQGIIVPEDYPNLKFQPEKAITRSEIAMMVVRGLGIEIESNREKIATHFLDDGNISAQMRPYIQKASEIGIISGYAQAEGFTFKPNHTATRAEAVILLYKFLQNKTELKQISYYAIDSFKQIEDTKVFDEIVFGWSSLKKASNGNIVFSMDNEKSDYKLPRGHESALKKVDDFNVNKKLMLTENDRELIYPLLENKSYQNKVIKDIVEALGTYGFTGIVMDLESIRDTEKGYRQHYVSFLKELKKALEPEGYELTVAVHPNNVSGFYDGYDYKGIAEVADEINLMAHDYHESNNQNMLTDHAPFDRVHEALGNLIDSGVPRDKIILGLQVVAGTQWITENRNGLPFREFRSPAMGIIYESLSTYQNHDSFSSGISVETLTPYYRYTLNENGQESRRLVRYEDQKSIESKILLAKFYGVKGVSFWRIGEIQKDIIMLIDEYGSN